MKRIRNFVKPNMRRLLKKCAVLEDPQFTVKNKYTVAKNVHSGNFVVLRGSKFINATPKSQHRVFGVYQSSHTDELVMMTLDGKIVTVYNKVPEGIVKSGSMKVRIFVKKEGVK